MKVFGIVFGLLISAPTRVFSQLSPERLTHFHNYAQSVADDLNAMHDSEGSRSLLSLTSSEFRTYVCDPYIRGYRESQPGASCTCSTSKRSVTCTSPSECIEHPDCSEDICGTSSITTEFLITNTAMGVTDVTVDVEYSSGSDYSGFRQRVYAVGNNFDNMKCEHFYSIGTDEYRCNSCSICSENAASIDCSNIQAGANTNGCMTIDDEDVHSSAVQLCVEGGAPLPTTDPVSGAQASFGVVALVAAFLVSTAIL